MKEEQPSCHQEQSLCRMVEQYQRSLLTLCYAYLHERGLAEDAVQETFLRAYKALDGFRGDCSEKTWLTSIAINVCRNMRRSGWFRHVDRSVVPEEVAAATVQGYDQQAADLAAAIQRMPDKLKEVILLYYYQQMTLAEIAGIVKVTPSMVSRRIKKAQALLQQLLGKEYLHE